MRTLALPLLLLLVGAPLGAGTVYVSVFDDFEVDGKVIAPHVLITNTDFTRSHSFETLWLPSETDGTVRGEELGLPNHVRAGATVLISATHPEGETGLLEIAAEEELVIDYRLVISDAAGGGLPEIITLPVMSSENVLAADEVAYLQGLERTRKGTRTDLVVVNLGHERSSCRFASFKSGGLQIQSPAVLSFAPLSQRIFEDAFATVGETFLIEGKFEISCNQPFFAYAGVTTPDLDVARVVRPSHSGTSDLLRPGEGPELVELSVPGLFLKPRQGASDRDFDIPLEPGVAYRRIAIDFDFLLDRWQSDLFHVLVGLRRAGDTLFFGLFLRGDNARTIIDRGDNTEFRDPGPWQQGKRYHVHIDYNAEAGSMTLEVRRNGQRIDIFTLQITNRDLVDNGIPVNLVFGMKKALVGAYFPPLGWEFSNLLVVATPF